jgi:DNA-binding MarR family transcriptional regulator
MSITSGACFFIKLARRFAASAPPETAPFASHLIMLTNNKSKSLKAELRSAEAKSKLFGRPGFLIRRLHQIHTWLFLEETGGFNITAVQYSLLTALGEHGEMDQNTVALEIGLERSSVAEVLPRLEDRGLIEREQSPLDKRVKLVKLSRKGRALVKRMEAAVQRAHDRTIDALPEEERDLFMLQLIRLVEANNEQSVVPLRLR